MERSDETIADIIAEKRRRAEEIERDCAEKMKRGEMTSDQYARELVADIRREADRIEAAHKRDHEYPKAQSLDADKLTGKNISGLVTDLRQIAKYHYAQGNIVQGQFARVMADRIEAAHKREIDGLKKQVGNAAKSPDGWKMYNKYQIRHTDGTPLKGKRHFVLRLDSDDPLEAARVAAAMSAYKGETPQGNAAKLRKALEFIKQYFDKIDPFNINTYTFSQIEVERINEATDAALSAPPRNCDVGTAEEQSKRKLKFCYKPGGCANRPFSKSATLTHCALAWAQMPYEESEAAK